MRKDPVPAMKDKTAAPASARVSRVLAFTAVAALIVSGCASTESRQARTPNPPEWIYGTWVDCNPSRRALLGPDWKFSFHNIQKYSMGYIVDPGSEIIREDQEADWYLFEYPNRGVPGGRHRFERDGDERSALVSNLQPKLEGNENSLPGVNRDIHRTLHPVVGAVVERFAATVRPSGFTPRPASYANLRGTGTDPSPQGGHRTLASARP